MIAIKSFNPIFTNETSLPRRSEPMGCCARTQPTRPDDRYLPCNQHFWTATRVMRRSVVVTLAVGLTLMVIAVVAVLARSPLEVAGTNSIPPKVDLELEKGEVGSCQPAGMLPQDTSAIRVAIEARAVGPMLTLRVLSSSHILAEGKQAAGWGPAPTVTVPVGRLARAIDDARICMTVGPTVEPFRFRGTPRQSPVAGASRLQGVSLHMEYLRPGPKSWWSLASSIAYHMGLGRAASGTWIVFLALALMLVVAILATRLALEEL